MHAPEFFRGSEVETVTVCVAGGVFGDGEKDGVQSEDAGTVAVATWSEHAAEPERHKQKTIGGQIRR